MPITSHKFGSIDPNFRYGIGDDNGQFVSSVCWRQRSNMVAATSSSGSIKLLQMGQWMSFRFVSSCSVLFLERCLFACHYQVDMFLLFGSRKRFETRYPVMLNTRKKKERERENWTLATILMQWNVLNENRDFETQMKLNLSNFWYTPATYSSIRVHQLNPLIVKPKWSWLELECCW